MAFSVYIVEVGPLRAVHVDLLLRFQELHCLIQELQGRRVSYGACSREKSFDGAVLVCFP